MATDRFVVAPFDTGLQNDVKPFLLPEDAFSQIFNAYVFRGRVTKRWGSRPMNGAVSDNVAQLYTRLGINIGTTDAITGNFAGNVPGIIFTVGQMFAVGDTIFTVFQFGTPGVMLRSDNGAVSTFNTSTGFVSIVGADPAVDVYFYPAQPVMGITSYQQAAINNEETIAFDTQFSYHYINGRWERLDTAPGKVWTGGNAQFFWSTNFRGILASDYILFTTNYNAPDFMAYWGGGPNWTNFRPAYNVAGNTVDTARIIIPFKQRLILLNTIETSGAGQLTFTNRARYSQVGNPLAADAFLQLPETAGKGGFVDAGTREAIISAQIIKDRLIVFFEQSTWELVYTNNNANPFLWQKINTEFGVESTFSAVVFDKVLMGIGNVGIVACNGANVERIDQKIPDEVFTIRNENDGVERVHGIRDYYHEMVYWTFPTLNSNNIYPNQVLAYNYRNGSWSFFDDSITTWGYYQGQDDLVWGNYAVEWGDADSTWGSAELQAQFRNIIAGNQEGFVFIVDDELNTNSISLQITDMEQTISLQQITLTIIDHNLEEEDFIYLSSIEGTNDFPLMNNQVWQVYQRLDENTFVINNLNVGAIGSNYFGGGTITLVSKVDIYTKMYNFYPQAARNMLVNKVDFNVDRTDVGAITVDYLTSSSVQGTIEGAALTGALLGNSVLSLAPYPLIPQEATRDYLIHPIYLQADGEWIQLHIYYADEQMLNYDVVSEDFELNSMIFYAQQTSSRLQ